MGIRPSYIGEEQRKKVNMIYDLQNIKTLLLQKPLYILILFLLAYIFFYISFLLTRSWYIALFSLFGWLSIIAIIALLIAHLLILLIKTTDEIPPYWNLLPYLTLPISYVLMRFLFTVIKSDLETTASLLVMIASTLIVTLLLLKYKTNKFKTRTEMDQVKVADAKRRLARERTR